MDSIRQDILPVVDIVRDYVELKNKHSQIVNADRGVVGKVNAKIAMNQQYQEKVSKLEKALKLMERIVEKSERQFATPIRHEVRGRRCLSIPCAGLRS